MKNNFVKIFDTTLRDGEQSPGATLTSSEKMEIAEALSQLGVDIIEAGFPAASPDDLEAVSQIAKTIGNKNQPGKDSPPIICGLARSTKSDIEKCWQAVQFAKKPRIHTFIATSDIHMEHKLKLSREEVLKTVEEMVSFAHSFCEDVEFSPEDAGRSDPEFLYKVLETAIKAGASTLNIPDTVGYTTPEEFGNLIKGIKENTPGIDSCTISVHCHNDLGMATANSLAGLYAGARQAEVTINGIGERAGNTSLEEIVMSLQTRKPFYQLETAVDSSQIMKLSKMVSHYTGIVVQPNKAIVGANAFAHEAGIHQDGVLKNQQTYEIMKPEMVGLQTNNLVLGKHSGRHALQKHLESMGHKLNNEELKILFSRFKKLADKKKTITDADLEALVTDEIRKPQEFYKLSDLQVTCGTMGMPTATVRLTNPDGKIFTEASVGTGPIDAAFNAVREIVDMDISLAEFSIKAITRGIDALGEVSVRIDRHTSENDKENSPKSYGGYGADTDIIVASVKAYLSAINKLITSSI